MLRARPYGILLGALLTVAAGGAWCAPDSGGAPAASNQASPIVPPAAEASVRRPSWLTAPYRSKYVAPVRVSTRTVWRASCGAGACI